MAAAAQSITKPADRGVSPALPDYPGTRAQLREVVMAGGFHAFQACDGDTPQSRA